MQFLGNVQQRNGMHTITTINGIDFIFSPIRDIETASFGIFLRTGSRFEDPRVRGIAHFLEHLLFKGSARYTYKEIKQEIEGRGGSLNGFTSHEITAYYAHFLNKNIGHTMDILLDMVCNPLLKLADVTKERGVVMEEIKMYNDLPAPRVGMLLDRLLWPGHALGDEVIGSFETVGRISRKDLAGFKKCQYTNGRMVVACVGNIKPQDIAARLRRMRVDEGSAPFFEAPVALKGVHVSVEAKKLEQAYLSIGFRSVSYSDRRKFVVELINVLLGANMSSRLFEEIREKRGLCYDISTEARKFKDSGAFVIQLGLDKTKIETALTAILQELTKLKTTLVGATELGRARDYFLGQAAMSLERPQGRMFYMAESHIASGVVPSAAHVRHEIESISAQDIRDLAREIFMFQNMCVSCIADCDEGTEQRLKKCIDKKTKE